MLTTSLPGDFPRSPSKSHRDDVFATKTRRVEFCLLSVLSLLATIVTLTVFGTHVSTWYGSLTLGVAVAGGR
jgi:hypothetical protein